MSANQIVLNPDIRRLQDEGYEVEVSNGHLLIHSVPYVTSQRTVALGTVVTDLNGTIGQLGAPKDHQVWFVGEFPCHQTGAPIEAIRHSTDNMVLWGGFTAQHRFSNILEGVRNYQDYYSKMKRYVTIISNEAQAIDPTATPCTFKLIVPAEENSVFKYWDSASSRANILPVSEKLAMDKVAVIGLGGTGAYVLDLIAKTPIKEIHLFDGDVFEQHNAFRSPGAASVTILEVKPNKVDYYTQIYDSMRTGVTPHHGYVTEDNLNDLDGIGFVFLCVDSGLARKTISLYLRSQGIPFVDVGMDLMLEPENMRLQGFCRSTLCTPEKCDHFDRYAHQGADNDDDLYRTNIQVADINALNAALAVIKWKQYRGFYNDHYVAHQSLYTIDFHSLTRDETTGATIAHKN